MHYITAAVHRGTLAQFPAHSDLLYSSREGGGGGGEGACLECTRQEQLRQEKNRISHSEPAWTLSVMMNLTIHEHINVNMPELAKRLLFIHEYVKSYRICKNQHSTKGLICWQPSLNGAGSVMHFFSRSDVSVRAV